jgi:hypothetical protein
MRSAGFEDIVPSISEEEEELARTVAKGLRARVGKGKAITNAQMRRKLAEQNIRIGGPKMRKIIQHIRLNNLVPLLVASSHGYYVAETDQEVEEYRRSLAERRRAIQLLEENLKFQLHGTRHSEA